jgi:mercuric ion transport protein
MKISRSAVASGVSVFSAFFSVLPVGCCVFPVALSFLGASGLAFASALMPYRPYFIVLTFISLGTAFYFTYRPQRECAPDEACGIPKVRRVQTIVFWVITALVLTLLVVPYLIPFLPL